MIEYGFWYYATPFQLIEVVFLYFASEFNMQFIIHIIEYGKQHFLKSLNGFVV